MTVGKKKIFRYPEFFTEAFEIYEYGRQPNKEELATSSPSTQNERPLKEGCKGK
jgi:hypothetical protein